MYNLRKTKRYVFSTLTYTKTNPVKRNIGESRKPEPNGKPGYIRVDSVHQEDKDGQKGVYYINSVDEITQWQIVLCTEKISGTYLLPIIEMLLEQYPFKIIEFHSDNGSEYINHWLIKLLNILLIKLTKNRSRKTPDKKGKQKKQYDIYQNPYQKLISIPNFEKYLKKDVTAELLKKIAYCMSDNDYTVYNAREKRETI